MNILTDRYIVFQIRKYLYVIIRMIKCSHICITGISFKNWSKSNIDMKLHRVQKAFRCVEIQVKIILIRNYEELKYLNAWKRKQWDWMAEKLLLLARRFAEKYINAIGRINGIKAFLILTRPFPFSIKRKKNLPGLVLILGLLERRAQTRISLA